MVWQGLLLYFAVMACSYETVKIKLEDPSDFSEELMLAHHRSVAAKHAREIDEYFEQRNLSRRDPDVEVPEHLLERDGDIHAEHHPDFNELCTSLHRPELPFSSADPDEHYVCFGNFWFVVSCLYQRPIELEEETIRNEAQLFSCPDGFVCSMYWNDTLDTIDRDEWMQFLNPPIEDRVVRVSCISVQKTESAVMRRARKNRFLSGLAKAWAGAKRFFGATSVEGDLDDIEIEIDYNFAQQASLGAEPRQGEVLEKKAGSRLFPGNERDPLRLDKRHEYTFHYDLQSHAAYHFQSAVIFYDNRVDNNIVTSSLAFTNVIKAGKRDSYKSFGEGERWKENEGWKVEWDERSQLPRSAEDLLNLTKSLYRNRSRRALISSNDSEMRRS